MILLMVTWEVVSIKRHGVENHTKAILEFLPTRQALRVREAEIVSQTLLEDTLCMNLCSGGINGDYVRTENTRKKSSKLSSKKNLERVAAGTNPWAGDLGTVNSKRICAQQISEGRHPFQNREKASERAQKRLAAGEHPFQHLQKLTCHCGKTGSAPNMRRWHFKNCKVSPS
jgi:hypothetical protein